jgi:hypothetical protein
MRLTKSEAMVYLDIKHSTGEFCTGKQILPMDMYPARDAKDNAKRRTISRLADAGHLKREHFPGYGDVFRVVDADAIEKAYRLADEAFFRKNQRTLYEEWRAVR